MSKRQALGKGLSSLIPEAPPAAPRAGVLQIDVGLIHPNPRQPRKSFDDGRIADLAASVKAHGVLQPVVVRRKGEVYELILGERRWRAALAAGLERIPALVREVDGRQQLEVALVENLQREDLNPLEEAEACALLIEEFDLTHDELAARLGRSRSHVSNLLRVTGLPETVRGGLRDGRLGLGHAKALAALEDADLQARLAAEVMEKELSVRQTEARVAALRAPADRDENHKIKKTKELRDDPNVRDAEERLKRALGAGVRIRGRARQGQIEIAFSSLDELQRLFEVLERAAGAAAPPSSLSRVTLPGRERPAPAERS